MSDIENTDGSVDNTKLLNDPDQNTEQAWQTAATVGDNDINVATRYTINEDGRVSMIEFATEDQTVIAKITDDDPSYYTYESDLLTDDKDAVKSETPLSLANVILAAYVNMGVIPPMQFDTIACRNKH